MNSIAILSFCTHLTFDLILRLRRISRLGIHPYGFWHTSRNTISMDATFYSILPSEEFFHGMDCQLCGCNKYSSSAKADVQACVENNNNKKQKNKKKKQKNRNNNNNKKTTTKNKNNNNKKKQKNKQKKQNKKKQQQQTNKHFVDYMLKRRFLIKKKIFSNVFALLVSGHIYQKFR